MNKTLQLWKEHFSWPSMTSDTQDFVAACITCATSKTSPRPCSALLQALHVPHRPWSHIVLDFVTELPKSDGNSVILTIVERFSKAAHFIGLPKLSCAQEAANLLVKHIFYLHGIPLGIVSDQGPQFTSQTWKSFCQALGATVSLTSGFHPESSGQAERAKQDLELFFIVCVLPILPPGVPSFPGLNTHTTHYHPQPQVCLCSSQLWVTSVRS